MRNLLNKYLTGASMIALTFSLNTGTANATCSPMPTCEELGYNKTSCPNGVKSLKCPFDSAKLFCGDVTNCSQIGYSTSGNCPSDTAITLYCPFDSSKKRCISHICDPNLYPIPPDTDCNERKGYCDYCGNRARYLGCHNGYKLDPLTQKCVSETMYEIGDVFKNNSGTAIGIVADVETDHSTGNITYTLFATNSGMLANTWGEHWLVSSDPQDEYTCTGGSPIDNSSQSLYADKSGKTRTQTGIQQCGNKMEAMQYAANYKPSGCDDSDTWEGNQCPGKGQWWLPSFGELAPLCEHQTIRNRMVDPFDLCKVDSAISQGSLDPIWMDEVTYNWIFEVPPEMLDEFPDGYDIGEMTYYVQTEFWTSSSYNDRGAVMLDCCYSSAEDIPMEKGAEAMVLPVTKVTVWDGGEEYGDSDGYMY